MLVRVPRLILLPALLALLPACGPEPRDSTPPSTTSPQKTRVDLYGDPLPPGAIARMGTARFRHEDSVNTIAFSPDGRLLISGTGLRETLYPSNAVYLWDLATGRERYRIAVPRGPVMSVAFSPDGKTWAMASENIDGDDNAISLRSASDGKELLRFHGHEILVWDVAFSPDGKTLASRGGDDTIRLWDVATGRERLKIEETDSGSPPTVAFSPDGRTLAAGYDLWDAVSGRKRLHLETDDTFSMQVVFSPDGNMLASAHESVVCLWNADTGKRIRERSALRGELPAFDFGDLDSVRSVVFSPNGNLLVVCWHSKLRVYDVATDKEVFVLNLLSEKRRGLYRFKSAAFSPDGSLLAVGCESGLIRMWDTATWTERHRREAHRRMVHAIALSPDGRTLASGSNDGTIRLWDAATGKPRGAIGGDKEGFASVAFSPDGKTLASGDAIGTVRLHDAATGSLLHTFTEKANARARGVAFSPDGDYLAATSPMCLWELDTGNKHLDFEPGVFGCTISFSPDGRIIASQECLWDAIKGKVLHRLAGHKNSIMSVAFSPDGKLLVTGSVGGRHSQDDSSIRLWEMATGKEIYKVAEEKGLIASVAFSPDGGLFASGGLDKTIRLRETATGKELVRLEGRAGSVLHVVFSPDGRRLASGHSDSTILIWDVAYVEPSTTRRPLKPGEMESWWENLAGDDSPRAHRAIWRIGANDGAVIPFLRDRLRPDPPDERTSERAGRILVDLDHDDIAVREKAARELVVAGSTAESMLLIARDAAGSAEVRARLDHILDGLHPPFPVPLGEPLRRWRAIQVLERIGSEETKEVLEMLANESPSLRERREAEAALERWRKR